METWRPVKDFEEYYEVSSLGRCRSLPRLIKTKESIKAKAHYKERTGKLLSPKKVGHYNVYQMCVDGVTYRMSIHIMVADAFLDNPQSATSVGFKDGDRTNCTVDNLFWRWNKRIMSKKFMRTLDKVAYEHTIMMNGGI
jgi:NUMOD4 motif.